MRIRIIIVLYFLPMVVFGQNYETSPDRFKTYLQKYLEPNSGVTTTSENLLFFIEKLGEKRAPKSDSEFLRLIFTKVHSKFLKHYGDYVPFDELLTSGKYNCLTGTMLYALVLDHFAFDYKVIETNYHIFLLVNTKHGRVLLEATDPQSGFVDDEKIIEEKINQYRQNKLVEASSNKSYYQFKFDLYNEVDLNELTGLLYYNLAVRAFNQHQIEQSISLLEMATSYYSSERIEEFSKVILLTLVHSNLESTTKQTYVNKVKSIGRSTIL